MRVTIEYNLPDDEFEYNATNNAVRYYCTLVELEHRLRTEMKYKDVQNAEHFMELFYDVLNEKGVHLES